MDLTDTAQRRGNVMTNQIATGRLGNPVVDADQSTLTSLTLLSQPGELWRELDELKQSVDDRFVLDDIFVGSVGGVASSLTVGYVIWMLRGGVLLSSLLAQMPAWKFIDPIVILPGREQEDDATEGDSLQSIVERNVEREHSEEGEDTELAGI